MWVLLAILAWPLVEIGLFVEIGGRIGLWPTLAWVIATAAAGVLAMRAEGARSQTRLRQGISALGRPDAGLGRGVFRMLAGLLLVLPGFLTDVMGLILLLPPVQDMLTARLLARVTVVQAGGRAAPSEPDVIEAEWEEVPQNELGRRGRSGWTED